MSYEIRTDVTWINKDECFLITNVGKMRVLFLR